MRDDFESEEFCTIVFDEFFFTSISSDNFVRHLLRLLWCVYSVFLFMVAAFSRLCPQVRLPQVVSDQDRESDQADGTHKHCWSIARPHCQGKITSRGKVYVLLVSKTHFLLQMHGELRQQTEVHLAQVAQAQLEEESKNDPII